MRAGTARWAMLLSVACAWALRVFHLGYQELRGDEAFGYFFQQSSFGQILADTIGLREPHPVGSYFVQKIWLTLAGDSEFALRFSSAWCSVLAVALLFRLGRRLGLPSLAAWLGATLLALSPYMLWHSQDARMYGMLLALITASSWCALEALHGERLRYWAAYVIVTWLALHTHYSAVFVLIAQNLFVCGWALLGRRARLFWRWLAAQVVLVLLYLPWLWLVGGNLAGYTGNGDAPGLPAMLYRSLSALAFGETAPAAWRVALAALAGGLLAWGFAKSVRNRAWALAGWWLALGLLVPLGATWLSGLNRPIFNERYLVAAVPPCYLLLAAGIALPARRAEPRPARAAWLGGAALVLVLAGILTSLFTYYGDPAYSKTHGWRDLAAALARFSAGLPAGQARVAENFPDPTLWYYYRGPVEHLVLPPAAGDGQGAGQAVDRLAQEGVQRVLLPLMPAPNWDPGGLASAALASRFSLAARRPAGAWPLEIYVRREAAHLRPLGVSFANGLTLASAGTDIETLAPGGLLAVYVQWAGSTAGMHGTEKIFIHLADAQGAPVAQADVPWQPAEPGQASSYALTLPAHLPAASYRLLVGLYDPAAPGTPRILTASGADHVLVGKLPVMQRTEEAWRSTPLVQ